MSKIKIAFIVSLLAVVVGLLMATFYVEFWLVPQALLAKGGYAAGVVVHVLTILVMLASAAVLSAWLSGWTIYQVQEKLVSGHLNYLTNAISNVVSGAWSNQASVEKSVFMAGARLGYDVRDQIPAVTRGDVLTGLGQMSLPEPKKLLGDTPEVIDEMGTFLNDLDRRKERLS